MLFPSLDAGATPSCARETGWYNTLIRISAQSALRIEADKGERSEVLFRSTIGRTIMKLVSTLAMVLVLVGGLNWGLVGLLDFNLVTTVLGDATAASRLVYDLVGLSAVYMAVEALMKRG